MTRHTAIRVNHFEAWLNESEVEMLDVEVEWSASTDPEGTDLCGIRVSVEFPLDRKMTIGELEEVAVTQMMSAARELSASSFDEMLTQLRNGRIRKTPS